MCTISFFKLKNKKSIGKKMKRFFYWVLLTIFFSTICLFSIIIRLPISLKLIVLIVALSGAFLSFYNLGKSAAFLRQKLKVEIIKDIEHEHLKK